MSMAKGGRGQSDAHGCSHGERGPNQIAYLSIATLLYKKKVASLAVDSYWQLLNKQHEIALLKIYS